jgi:hypothetical protein
MNEQQNFRANTHAEEYFKKKSGFDREGGVAAWRLVLGKSDPIESVLE